MSIQTEREIESPVHPNPGIVGIDLGVARFATLSDGTVIAPGRFLARHEARLKRLQRALLLSLPNANGDSPDGERPVSLIANGDSPEREHLFS